MENLTAEQAAELAKNFLGFAQSIGNYRFTNWKKLSKEENQALSDKQWSILNAGEDMLALSTTLEIGEADDSLRKIKLLTGELDKTILQIKKIQKVINIGTAVIQLAAVIIGKQPLAVPGAINNLVKAIK
ncbi:MAG: hypothetical protein EOO39_03385 [Cytophagaceae bacterium]|nr:MAG: hypothetical protein EOO39_03385 [Cytophagaceae bacterium]